MLTNVSHWVVSMFLFILLIILYKLRLKYSLNTLMRFIFFSMLFTLISEGLVVTL